ncbi:MAG: D-2-hydroxyacid dehydrogenase [Opitutales bacterium]|nr:D-2-hydroxyacid dehydrogenase [Opitutales bacterium]
MKIVVLDAETIHFPEHLWEPFRKFGELILHDHTPAVEETIVERCRDAEIVLTNKVPLSAGILAQLPNLRLISVLATGYNVIDLEAAGKSGITVCNVPAYSTASVVQHTLALTLALLNDVAALNASVYQGDWVNSRHFCYWQKEIREVSEMTVGLVGYGDIGKGVARVFQALGAEVKATVRRPRAAEAENGVTFVDLPTLFRECDIVSLHCPLTIGNTRFVNRALLQTMKPHALLINTARGGLIHETELAAALNEGLIGGAGLDVSDKEPMAPDSPLLKARRCMITPHVAWAGRRSRERLLEESVANVEAFLAKTARNVVR